MSAALLVAAGLLLPAAAPAPPEAVVVVASENMYSAPDEGLYVGDGRFISATTHETPVVREDRLDDPHWSSSYPGARRPR